MVASKSREQLINQHVAVEVMSCVGPGVEEGDLDYNEDLDDITSHLRRPSEEDEVKVHAAVEIEDGELSSGEEGEIKGGCGLLVILLVCTV